MARPKDIALLLLGAGQSAPRQRARDQQADAAGLDLKRRVLLEVVARDPDPDGLEAVLMEIVDAFGAPAGPTRAVARSILEECRFAAGAPGWVAHLLDEAVNPPQRKKGNRSGGNLPA